MTRPALVAGRRIQLFDMVLGLSRALDLLHTSIGDHHLRVAYIACCIAEELGLSPTDIQTTLIAGALHDAGTVSSPQRLGLLDHALINYEIHETAVFEDIHEHGRKGFELLRDFPPFAAAASAVRFHHVEWEFGRGAVYGGEPVPPVAAILLVADRIAILPDARSNILEQVAAIRKAIAADSGKRFMPEAVAAFQEASMRESFWLDIASEYKEVIIRDRFGGHEVDLDIDALLRLSKVFGKIVDYRSHFTATHSSSVAVVAHALGTHLGLSDETNKLLMIAGYLHDLGKLAVPPMLLDKPGKLTDQEILLIKQHPYYTYRILSAVAGLETITTWASLHHERLDRKGYPFRPKTIPLEARIVAVADVFTAITEDRPYRKGMDQARSLNTLERMAAECAIDREIVAVLRRNSQEIRKLVTGPQNWFSLPNSLISPVIAGVQTTWCGIDVNVD